MPLHPEPIFSFKHIFATFNVTNESHVEAVMWLLQQFTKDRANAAVYYRYAPQKMMTLWKKEYSSPNVSLTTTR